MPSRDGGASSGGAAGAPSRGSLTARGFLRVRAFAKRFRSALRSASSRANSALLLDPFRPGRGVLGPDLRGDGVAERGLVGDAIEPRLVPEQDLRERFVR